MRSLILATTLGAAQSLAVANKSKKPAIQALMESATTMLKNGATPAVVDFAEETLNEVSGVVIPAIINESENDQRFIYSLHSRFQVIRDALAEENQEVFQLNAEEQTLSTQHKTCRDVEHQRCNGKRECEMELYRLWTSWVTEEEELREIHGYISGHFCPPDANGTLHAFRVASVPWMQQYMSQKVIVDEAEYAYDQKVPDCVVTHGALDAQSAICNQRQTQLEEKACAHALKISEVLNTYYADFAQASSTYSCAVEEIMQLERDRKREWVTLQVVNCLLERIREQNGVPCDDSNGGVTEEVGVCEERHGIAVCSTEEGEPRLCLDYPPIPPNPPTCPARDQVIGECLPVAQETPCCGAWFANEYSQLPEVPLPPFSDTNPGCNAYPECVHCPAIPDPDPINIDACPGYTVDGCSTSGDEEHPLTFVRDVDGTADVRCCSIDGETCQSQDFEGGVDFETPNGGIHTQCYFGVTYQKAMEVCHAAGKRICTTDEMDTCCGTGCWHNHNAIWVNVANNHTLKDTSLALQIQVENTSSEEWDFTTLLHTYFMVDDITKTTVKGLQGKQYVDKLDDGALKTEEAELKTVDSANDRIYQKIDKELIIADGGNAVLVLKSSNFSDAVVWNPWVEGAKKTSDFDDEGYLKMLCVEAGQVSTPVALKPGEIWKGAHGISLRLL